jgi:hypothetical protein
MSLISLTYSVSAALPSLSPMMSSVVLKALFEFAAVTAFA